VSQIAAKTEYCVGRIDDLQPGCHIVVPIGPHGVGVFNVGGAYYALPNRCPHQGGPLCSVNTTTGTTRSDASNDWRLDWVLEGEIIACPWHGLEFHVPTGQCLALRTVKIKPLSTFIREDLLFVVA